MSEQLPFTVNTNTEVDVLAFFDHLTYTFSYIVKDPNSNACAIIDSVLDFDYASGTISYQSAERLIDYIVKHNLELCWVLETHVHADHLSAAPYIQQHLGGKVAMGEHITVVQETFGKIFNEGTQFARDGSQFDALLSDGECFNIGNMGAHALHTPGHTPACMTYVIGDAAFVGDTLFMPDSGTARADFPGGDARQLYHSIQRILSLPEHTRLFMCHDYCPNGRNIEYQTTVAAQRHSNIHIKQSISEDAFVSMREQRDATLDMPTLILPSLQVNMRAGKLPTAEDNGIVYLKLPINAFV